MKTYKTNDLAVIKNGTGTQVVRLIRPRLKTIRVWWILKFRVNSRTWTKREQAYHESRLLGLARGLANRNQVCALAKVGVIV